MSADALLALSRPLAAARVLQRTLPLESAASSDSATVRRRLLVAQALLHADRLVDAQQQLDAVAGAIAADADTPVVRLLHLTRAGLEFRRERPRAALQSYRLLFRLGRRADRMTAIIDGNLGNSLSAAGRPRAAHRRFAMAREGFVAFGAPQLCASVDQNEAYAHLREGDLAHALTLFDEALDAAERSADLTLFPALCLDRAEMFLQLAMPAEARREIDRLRARVQRLTPPDAAQAAFVEGVALLAEERHDEAVDTLTDVAAEYRQMSLAGRAAHCSLLEARARLRQGDVEGAARAGALALDVLTSRRDPRHVSAELLAADVACRRGLHAEARAHLEAARGADPSRLPPWVRLDIARTEAEVARLAGDGDARRDALLRAADVLDAHMGQLPLDEFLIGFLAARSWLYEALAADGLERGDAAAAFAALERGRARALVELLGAPTPLRATLSEHRVARRRRELGLAELALHEAATRAEGVNAEQLTTRAERLEATRRRAREAPPAARLDWQRIPERLPGGVTLLELAWLGDRLHAFVVREGSVAHVPLDVDRASACAIVDRLAFQFRTARIRRRAGRQETASQRALDHHLDRADAAFWAPLADHLPDGEVVVVAAEHLHLVPFHALAARRAGDAPSPVTVSYAPSATSFVTPPPAPRAEGRLCTVFALADEAAPEIADEARAIASVWPETEIVKGERARLATFRERVRTSRVVHVATHGVFEETAPLFSSLRLADAWVNAYDVYGMHVAADLVVLAACETARSVATRDADLLGLVRAFLVAGAANVLAPQWPVSDAAARTYSVACFEALRAGARPAAAARRAAALTRGRHPHPADWAGWFAYCRADA